MGRHLWVWGLILGLFLSGGVGQAQAPRTSLVTPAKGTSPEGQPTSSSVDANTTALHVNVVAGGGGGGAAQTQVRNSGDTAWVNVGPAAGNAKMPATIYSSGGTELATATNPLRVDPTGTTTQPVSGTVTANQGGAPWTGRLQDGVGATLATITAGNALKVDGSAVTQPVSGTVTANQGGTWTVQPGNTANTTAWLVTGTGGTFPVTGTVTSNQGGAPWTQRIQDGVGATLATVTAGNALKVDGSAATQPVSGTVTSNQGGAPWTMRVQDGVGATLATVTAGNALKVDGSGVTQPVSGTVTTTPPANASTNLTQVGGNAVVTGTGVSGLGIPRVTVSNDSTVILGAGAATIGALTANQSVNVAQIAGTATVTASAGVQRVGIAGAANAVFDAANNAAVPANVLITGLETITATGSNPASATSGNVRRKVADIQGNQFVRIGGPNGFSCFVQAVTVTTQCQAAPAAGLRAYVMSASMSNQAATVQTLDIIFGTGVNCATVPVALTHKLQMGTNATTTSPQDIELTFVSPLVPTAANAICVRPSAASAFGATLTGFIAP